MMRWIRIAMVLVLAGIAPLAQAVDCIMHSPQVTHHHEMAMPVAQCFGDAVAATIPDGATALAVAHHAAPVVPAAVLGAWQQPLLRRMAQAAWPPGQAQALGYDNDVINRTGRRRI